MLLLAFLGGLLTIASPCILPVIPLVFARAGRPGREALPLLLGVTIAFTGAALIASATARWVLAANEVARILALVLLAAVAATLLSERAASWVARPVSLAGGRLLQLTDKSGDGWTRNMAIGVAIGLLWAPCAGPVLGLLIAAAATTTPTTAALLYFTFASGAVTMLAVVLGFGKRVMKLAGRLGAAESYVRRGLGVATLATVIALAFGWDRDLFAKAGLADTGPLETALVSRLAPKRQPELPSTAMSLTEFARVNATPALPTVEGEMPPFDGATEWINSKALTPASLRGKVVLVQFWTFACYNCLNALPHVKALEAKYRDRGLVVVGVHTPELARERVLENVRREVKRLGIVYPVVVDNDYTIWNAYHNQYWPAAYYIDATGKLRFYHFGEGRYEEQDQVVAKLLAEAESARTTSGS